MNRLKRITGHTPKQVWLAMKNYKMHFPLIQLATILKIQLLHNRFLHNLDYSLWPKWPTTLGSGLPFGLHGNRPMARQFGLTLNLNLLYFLDYCSHLVRNVVSVAQDLTPLPTSPLLPSVLHCATLLARSAVLISTPYMYLACDPLTYRDLAL